MIKYRVHEVAKDFGTTYKALAEILTKYSETPKNHMQVLTDRELNIIFDYLTFHNQVASLDEIYAEGRPAQPKVPEKAPEPVQPAPEKTPEPEKAAPAKQAPVAGPAGGSGTEAVPARAAGKQAPAAREAAPGSAGSPGTEAAAARAEARAAPAAGGQAPAGPGAAGAAVLPGAPEAGHRYPQHNAEHREVRRAAG